MAVTITENKIVMGQPAYRFEVSSENGTEFFEQGWLAAVKAYNLHKKGVLNIVCREWNKKERIWFDVTEETIAEGYNRAERSKNGKSLVEKEYVPSLTDNQVGTIKGAAKTLSMVAINGKNILPSEEDKKQVGMELMEVLSALGYSIKEIKALVIQYGHSVDAQSNPVPPELVK